MKVNTVSANSKYKPPKYNNTPFKGVTLAGLQRQEILGLVDDGPGIIRMLDKVIPVLERKFGELFDMSITVRSNFFRYIITQFSGKPAAKKYIIDNNDKIFNFSDFAIKSLKEDDYLQTAFLRGERYFPLDVNYVKLGEQKACEAFYKFTENYDANRIIKEMYELETPHPIEKKSSYLIHSTNIYGDPSL